MRRLAVVCFMLLLSHVADSQMTPQYDMYTSYALDANLNLSQTIVVEGYTSTPTGSCNTTCCQGSPYPPYYTCWSCPIPGCSGSTHTPRIHNVLGSAGGWSTGPAYNPFAYMTYQTTTQYHMTEGQEVDAAVEGYVDCSVVGTFFSGFDFPRFGIRDSSYVYAGLSNGRCSWIPTCTGTCSSPHTTNTFEGRCFSGTNYYKACWDLTKNGQCWVYRILCLGTPVPGACT